MDHRKRLSPDEIAEIRKRAINENKSTLAREFGVDRTTIFRYLGPPRGYKTKLSPDTIAEIRKRAINEKVSALAREFGVSRSTLKRHLKNIQ